MTVSDAPVRDREPASDSDLASACVVPLRLAITSVFGDPLCPLTWSGAPANLAQALRGHDIEVLGLNPPGNASSSLWEPCRRLLSCAGLPFRKETLLRTRFVRGRRALAVLRQSRKHQVDSILHTGTLDLPAPTDAGRVQHYLYCDHTWDLAHRHCASLGQRKSHRHRCFEELEREAYDSTAHIFTFGHYVRDNLIEHYGVEPRRVTAVGSGMGPVRPYAGAKDYARGHLLFIAKHLFVEKGGRLALKAFRLARRLRPDLRLIIVGNDRWHRLVAAEPGVQVMGHLPWPELEELLHSAALLLQPMFNDPWGQVYLEALASRTPVIGLDRNGLPEITENGRHGFLVRVADPVVLAEAIVDAMSDPARLERKGRSGQRHVLSHYSWERVAQVMAARISAGRPCMSAPQPKQRPEDDA